MQFGNLFSNKVKHLYLNSSGPHKQISKYFKSQTFLNFKHTEFWNRCLTAWLSTVKTWYQENSYLRGKDSNWEKNSGDAWRNIQIRSQLQKIAEKLNLPGWTGLHGMLLTANQFSWRNMLLQSQLLPKNLLLSWIKVQHGRLNIFSHLKVYKCRTTE